MSHSLLPLSPLFQALHVLAALPAHVAALPAAAAAAAAPAAPSVTMLPASTRGARAFTWPATLTTEFFKSSPLFIEPHAACSCSHVSAATPSSCGKREQEEVSSWLAGWLAGRQAGSRRQRRARGKAKGAPWPRW